LLNFRPAGRSRNEPRSLGDTYYKSAEDPPPDAQDEVEVIAIPVGAFADPGFPPPVFSVYEARKHAWVRIPENIEHMD